MKKQYLLLKAILIPVFLIAYISVWAQYPTYKNRLMNDYQSDAFTYEFDIYLLHDGGGTPLELATYQAGIYFDPGIVNGGGVTCTILPGTSELLPSQQPSSVSVANGASGQYCRAGIAYYIIRLASKTPPGAGNGTIISTVSPGTRVCRLRLRNTVAFGQFSPINCFNFTTFPYNTVVRAYINGTHIDITNSTWHLISDLYNPILNKPVGPYNVTGTGSYCSGTGGLPVGLDGSEVGCNFTLSGGGTTLPGTGAALSWGNQLAGTFTIAGTRFGTYIINVPMIGSAILTEIDVPAAAGTITGPAVVNQGDLGKAYSVPTIAGATSYNWGTTGTGWNINGVTENITIDFGIAATSGTLSVAGHNVCGDGIPATLDITVNSGGGPVTLAFGGLSSDWFNPLNWTPNGVPGATTDVILPGGLANYPNVTGPATCHTMYLEDGATILGNGNIVFTGKAPATVERNISGNWTTPCFPNFPTALTAATVIHFLSSPVTGAPWSTFEKDAIFRWDEPLQIWTGNWYPQSVSYWWDCTDPYPHTNAIPVGLGLEVAINQDWFAGSPVYSCLPIALCEAPTAPIYRRYFNGSLNSGDYNINLSYTGNVLPFAGWNLIGNPYPSAVDWTLVTKLGPIFANSASIWNPALPGYVNVIGAGIDIPYTQSVFVQTAGAASSVTFTEASRKIGTLPLKVDCENFIALNVSNGSTWDETYVTFNPEANSNVDMLDGRKLQNGEGAPMIYSRLADDTHLAYNTLPTMDGNPVVFVDFIAGSDGEYTITAKELESFATGYSIFLEDLALGNVQNLMENNTYSFSATTNDDPARFKLFFGAVGMEELGNVTITIYSSQKDVFITYNATDDATATIYNSLGQPVITQLITPGKTHKISLNTPSGYYIVKAVNNDDVVAQKVFIR
ncbi:MAG: T9SS type A sorting domain-containing protein [Bacteroidetes bacterium]|nr:T9SS type A sorting domain-containing protein [Bacteroidota bacterium]